MHQTTVRTGRAAAFLLAFAMLAPSAAFGATNVGGTLAADTTWTLAGSPYIVGSDLIVPAGVTLTIAAGVQVQAATSDSGTSGTDSSRVEIIVEGALVTQGTEANPVTFTTPGASGSWYGIRVLGGTATRLTHARIEKARYAVTVSGTQTLATIRHGAITGSSERALRVSSGHVDVAHTQFTGNTGSYTIIVESSGRASLDHLTIADNSGYGLYISSSGSTATLTNSIAVGNQYGIYRNSGSITLSHNNVWGNSSANYSGVGADGNSFSANPLFIGSGNYRITSMSPARQASSDGSDLGALPYVSDETPGLLGKLVADTTWSGNRTLTGDLIIPEGVTLTLAAGTTLTAATTDQLRSGTDSTRVEIIVEGALVTQGTEANPVTFTTPGAAGSWHGIRVLRGSGTNLSHVRIDKARYGLSVSGTQTLATVSHGAITGTTTRGIEVSAGQVNVAHTLLAGNTANYTVYVGSAGTATLDHLTIADNSSYGLYVTGTGSSATLTNSIVVGNQYGVFLNSGSLTLSHNNVWGNSSSNYGGKGADGNSISANPLFVGSGNYRITSMSPARKAASDGSDLGALPYVNDATPGVAGKLVANETWSGNHTLTGDLIIPEGVTLTLAAGTRLTAATTDLLQSGSDTSRVEIIVEGALVTQGTEANPVVFTTNGAAGSWHGIRVLRGSGTNLSHARIENARYGLSVSGTQTLATVSHGAITGSTTRAIEVSAGQVNVAHSLLTGNIASSTVYVTSSGTATLDHLTIADNSGYGLYVTGTGTSATLTNSIVVGNQNGVYLNSGSLNLSHNNVWGNSSSNYGGKGADGNSISANPLFVGSGNYRITSMSPARKAASDGSDLGALPYVNDVTPGLAGKLVANETWSGNRTLTGDLIIPQGVTLTLAAGTTLTAATTDLLQSGSDTSRVEIIVEGALVTQGTEANPVIFTTNGAAGSWHGIRVLRGSGTNLAHVRIDKARYGLSVSGAQSLATVSHGAITGSTTRAIEVSDGQVNVSRTLLAGNIASYTVYVGSAGTATLDHLTIADNGGYGLYASGTGTSATLTNSIVTGNQNGVYQSSSAAITLSHNDVWGNSSSNYSGVSPDVSSFSANPLFVGSGNYRITSMSPARKAASDGSDLGALPYVNDATPGVAGKLVANETWSGSKLLVGDLIIPEGVTLTLAAGTTLTAATTDLLQSGADSSRVEIIVEGALVTQGGFAGRVTFTTNGAAGSWYGIRVLRGSGTNLSHAHIENARYGLLVSGMQTLATMSHGSITGSTTRAIEVIAGQVNVARTLLSGNSSSYTVYVGSAGTATLDHLTIADNSGYGLYVTGSGSSATLTNSIVVRNQYGVYRSTTAAITLSHNDVWGNSSYNYSGVSEGQGSLSTDPLFVLAGDYRLQPGSPCLGAGADGSDLGAFPFGPGPLEYLVITPVSATVAAGGSIAFSAQGFDARNNAIENLDLTWSAHPSAGSISADGLLVASCTPGTISGAVTVSAEGKSATVPLTIEPGPLASLTVSPATASVEAGSLQTFSAIAADACGNVLTVPVAWSVATGAGSITTGGLYTAPCQPGSYPAAVVARSGDVEASVDLTVATGSLAQLAITPVNPTIPAGAQQQFSVAATDACGNLRSDSIDWSADRNAGSITSTGLFTAGGQPGTWADAITATSGAIAASTGVTVTGGALAQLQISPASVTLEPGESETFTVVGRDAFGNVVPVTPNWEVVGGGGSIHAVSGLFIAGTVAGSFTDTVQVSADGIHATATVVVKPGPAARLTITPPSVTLAPGGSTTFSAQVFDAWDNQTSDTITWEVQTPAAGTITAGGKFVAGAELGNFPNAVRATSGLATATASVTIEPGALATLQITPAAVTVRAGATVAFQVKGFDASGNELTIEPVWSVLHGGGDIDESGVFTAGTVPGSYLETVQAQAGGLAATASVIVTAGPVVSVEVSPAHPTLAPGSTQQFSATASDAFGNPITNATPVWSADPAAGTITSSGLFTAAETEGDFAHAVTAEVEGIVGHAAVEIRQGSAPDGGTELPPDAGECEDCTPVIDAPEGCGCGSTGSLMPLAAVLLLLPLMRRRRRAA